MTKTAMMLGVWIFAMAALCASPAFADEVQPGAAKGAPVFDGASRIERLANGLTVLVREDHRFPIVSTRLYVHAGSAYEKPEWAGISHLLEHMVFKGTERRPKGEISREVEGAGGYMNAATSFDYTVYITDMPSRSWKLGMDVVGDMAFHAAIDPEELKSEKEVVIAELKRGKDNPRSVLFEQAQSGALKGTPYGHPIIGYEETIRAITPEDIRAYIRELYQPGNMLLVVAGDVESGAALAEAEKVFGGCRNTSTLASVQALDASRLGHGASVSVSQGAWNKVYLTAALPVPGLGSSQSAGLDVLAQLLGGDATSMLPRVYRHERRLVDSISVANISFERVGLLLISAELEPEKLKPFWESLVADMSRLDASAFSDRELSRAKLNIEEELYRTRETVSGMASHLGYMQFFLGGEQGEANIIETIRSVDRAALQRLIRAWLVPERLTACALEPRAEGKDTGGFMRSALEKGWPASSAVSGSRTAEALKTEIVDLGQGRRVVLIPDRSMPHFALEMAFSGGETLISAREQGLAALAARVLPKGTQKHDSMSVQQLIADRAGSVGASTGRRAFSVSLEGPSRFSAELAGLFREILTQPAFAPADVAREKAAQQAAIRAAEDKPLALAFRKMPPLLFPGSVFGYETLGQPEAVAAFTPDQVRGFWDRQKLRPWVMAVAGDFDREAVLAFAKSLPVPSEPAVQAKMPDWGSEKQLSLRLPERGQSHLILVFPTASEKSPEAPALGLMEETLGGMGGPLFRMLRDDKGLGYTVSAHNMQNDLLGYMLFYIGTEPSRLEEARSGFEQILASLGKEPLPSGELARGLAHWEGSYYRELQSLGRRASEAASLVLTDRPLDFYRRQIEEARKAAPETLRDLAARYFRFENAYVLTVTP